MARDLDFVKRKPTTQPPRPAVKTERKLPTVSKISFSRPMLIGIVVSVVVIFSAILLLNAPFNKTNSRTSTDTQQSTDTTTATASETSKVIIYDRGAGNEVVSAISAKISELYPVLLGEEAQFSYSSSYIYYSADQKAKADQIVSQVPERKFILKESPTTGVFVYLGTN